MIDVEEILSKMNPNQKINYDRVMQKMVKASYDFDAYLLCTMFDLYSGVFDPVCGCDRLFC